MSDVLELSELLTRAINEVHDIVVFRVACSWVVSVGHGLTDDVHLLIGWVGNLVCHLIFFLYSINDLVALVILIKRYGESPEVSMIIFESHEEGTILIVFRMACFFP